MTDAQKEVVGRAVTLYRMALEDGTEVFEGGIRIDTDDEVETLLDIEALIAEHSAR